MKKYCIQSIKGTTIVQELSVEHVTFMEDQSLAWVLRSGESLYKILAPASLKGERYFSFAMHDTADEALTRARRDLTHEAERTARKAHVEVDHAALDERLKAIKVQSL